MPGSPLELDIPTILFEIINFLILTVVLYRVLFRRVMDSVKARAAEKERLSRQLAQDQQEAMRLQVELESRLANIDQEAADIVARAQRQIEAERKAMLEAAESEVGRLLMEAQVEAGQIQQQAMDQFHDDLLETILDISSRFIGQAAPAELHDSLVQQLNDRIWELGRSERRQVEAIRRALGERAPTAHVTSAQTLSPEQQRLLVRTLSALADHNVQLDLKTDPALIAGLHVRMGDMIVENSIRAQLAELRADVAQALEESTRDV